MSKDQASRSVSSNYPWQTLGSVPHVRLEDLLDQEERDALADILVHMLHYGWGEVSIEVVQHKVRYFHPRFSITSKRSAAKNRGGLGEGGEE